MPSKSEIKTKLINKVKYLSIFFFTSYYMIKIPYGGEKHKMGSFVKSRDIEKNIRMEKCQFPWLSKNCILSSRSYF